MSAPRINISGGDAKTSKQLNDVFGAYSNYLDSLEKELKAIEVVKGQNTRVTRTGRKFVVHAEAQADAPARIIYPFEGKIVAGSSGSTCLFKLTSLGQLYPVGLPTNTFVAGKLWKSEELPTTGAYYIQLHVLTDGQKITSCVFQGASTPAAPIGLQAGAAPASFDIDLYAIFDGKAYRAIGNHNLSAAAKVGMVTEKPPAGLACGEYPLVRYMTWEVRPA